MRRIRDVLRGLESLTNALEEHHGQTQEDDEAPLEEALYQDSFTDARQERQTDPDARRNPPHLNR